MIKKKKKSRQHNLTFYWILAISNLEVSHPWLDQLIECVGINLSLWCVSQAEHTFSHKLGLQTKFVCYWGKKKKKSYIKFIINHVIQTFRA